MTVKTQTFHATKQKITGARDVALSVLCRVHASGSYAGLSLHSAMDRAGLDAKDRSLCTRLTYGVIEKEVRLDYILCQLSSIPLSDLDPDVLDALRLGLYQLMETDRIPAHAAINETVSLVSRKKSGYVNALLRNYLRKKDDISFPDPEKDPVKALSVETSVPYALAGRMTELFGEEGARAYLSCADPDKLTLRTNTLQISREDLLSLLSKAHPELSFEKTPYAKAGIVTRCADPQSLTGFHEGLFMVQDEASQLCVELAGAFPDAKILDSCACPGSKSFGMAMDAGDRAQILSCDLHKSKLSLIESGADRLGIRGIRTLEHDGKVPLADTTGKMDIVLCDVPCSGFGVLSKKPEIRHKDLSACAALPDIQYGILCGASASVRPGGTLIYSTCTVLPEENRDVIEKFVRLHPDFVLTPFVLGPSLGSEDGMLTLLPHIHHTDGFFMARLERRSR